MLLKALREFKDHPTIQLQVRGYNPNWPEEAKKEMRDAGLWLEFAPRTELDTWLQSADAFLIPMVFDEKYRRRMETSFPSKLIEFAQFGKPLIVWGPKYCSAAKWAMELDLAHYLAPLSALEFSKNLSDFLNSKKALEKYSEQSHKIALQNSNHIIMRTFISQILKINYKNKIF
jgi:hypothetical protein